MSWRPTWVLLAGALALAAFILFVERPLRHQRELEASRTVLPDFNPAEVTNIEVHPWGLPLIKAAREKTSPPAWKLVQPIAYRADDYSIEALLQQLSKLEWVDRHTEKELANNPAPQEQYGFAKPSFTILLQGSGPDRRLEIGNFGTFKDRVSMQIVGNNNIYDVASELLRFVPTDKDNWRDITLLDVTNLAFTGLRVSAPGKGEFELERDPANHLWFVKNRSARADTPKMINLLSNLQNVTVSAFMNDNPQADLDPYGLLTTDTSPPLTLTFLNGSNNVAGLQVGGIFASNTNYIYVRRDAPGNIVLVPRNSFNGWALPYTNFLDQHFISISPSFIESIKVRGDDDFVAAKGAGSNHWTIHGSETFPADPALMEYWMAAFTNVPTGIVKAVVTDFSPYGLSNACLQYDVRFNPGAGAQTEARIDFGTNKAGNVFERREDETFVNSIDADDFRWLPRVSWQLRDRAVWNFESTNVVSVTVHQLGGTLKFLRDPEGNWTYAPGYNNQVQINSPAIEECVVRMGHLRAVYWDGVGDKNLDKFGFEAARYDIEFEVTNGTRQIYKIQFGDRSPLGHPYATVVKNGKRFIFEFRVDLYQNLVLPNLTLYTARQFIK